MFTNLTYSLDEIKERTEEHRRNKNKPDFNKYLRFSCESEILLWTHIQKSIDKKNILFIGKNEQIFFLKRR